MILQHGVSLLNRRAKLRNLLLIHVRSVPHLLIEVSQLAGRSGDLNVLLRGAIFSGGRATACGVLGTRNWTTSPYREDLSWIDTTYVTSHTGSPKYL